ncbi:hypothetical protein FHP25_28270 [Vineibacter terrae]|uniref:Uncharacterized protein n=1 Tax=Vineibacter terrae TaxID=2586908 RepID=A0A5C8PEN2_9HYPH|nr:hypothetical protein [Vineibacter terrae]TXL71769.1 hypothetical protein FHP25_28270 [Vineibacter terrae]
MAYTINSDWIAARLVPALEEIYRDPEQAIMPQYPELQLVMARMVMKDVTASAEARQHKLATFMRWHRRMVPAMQIMTMHIWARRRGELADKNWFMNHPDVRRWLDEFIDVTDDPFCVPEVTPFGTSVRVDRPLPF